MSGAFFHTHVRYVLCIVYKNVYLYGHPIVNQKSNDGTTRTIAARCDV